MAKLEQLKDPVPLRRIGQTNKLIDILDRLNEIGRVIGKLPNSLLNTEATIEGEEGKGYRPMHELLVDCGEDDKHKTLTEVRRGIDSENELETRVSKIFKALFINGMTKKSSNVVKRIGYNQPQYEKQLSECEGLLTSLFKKCVVMEKDRLDVYKKDLAQKERLPLGKVHGFIYNILKDLDVKTNERDAVLNEKVLELRALNSNFGGKLDEFCQYSKNYAKVRVNRDVKKQTLKSLEQITKTLEEARDYFMDHIPNSLISTYSAYKDKKAKQMYKTALDSKKDKLNREVYYEVFSDLGLDNIQKLTEKERKYVLVGNNLKNITDSIPDIDLGSEEQNSSGLNPSPNSSPSSTPNPIPNPIQEFEDEDIEVPELEVKQLSSGISAENLYYRYKRNTFRKIENSNFFDAIYELEGVDTRNGEVYRAFPEVVLKEGIKRELIPHELFLTELRKVQNKKYVSHSPTKQKGRVFNLDNELNKIAEDALGSQDSEEFGETVAHKKLAMDRRLEQALEAKQKIITHYVKNAFYRSGKEIKQILFSLNKLLKNNPDKYLNPEKTEEFFENKADYLYNKHFTLFESKYNYSDKQTWKEIIKKSIKGQGFEEFESRMDYYFNPEKGINNEIFLRKKAVFNLINNDLSNIGIDKTYRAKEILDTISKTSSITLNQLNVLDSIYYKKSLHKKGLTPQEKVDAYLFQAIYCRAVKYCEEIGLSDEQKRNYAHKYNQAIAKANYWATKAPKIKYAPKPKPLAPFDEGMNNLFNGADEQPTQKQEPFTIPEPQTNQSNGEFTQENLDFLDKMIS